MNQYLYVGIAVLADTAGATALKAADGFRVPVASLLALLGYGTAFFFLALAVRTIPIGVANALWSGLSIVMVAVAGLVFHHQPLDRVSVLGMALIIAGIFVLNLGSSALKS